MNLSVKCAFAGLLLVLSAVVGYAQVTVRIDSFPQNLQLYQRGTTNLARVAVTGTAPTPYTQVSLKVLRQAAPYFYQKQAVGTANAPGSFSFGPNLRAEAVEYEFLLYAHRSSTDSVLIGRAGRVVCGDVLILYGQSNVVALHDIDGYVVDDRLLRNFMHPYLSTNIPNELSWSVAKQPYGTVGGIGLWLQKLILEKYGIPTCVMNGGVGGTPISSLSNRDSSDHANLDTYYGLLLYRARRAGLADKARIIVYKQGEADAAFNTDRYGDALRKLTDQFEEDYPAVKKIYVSQLNIIADPTPRSGQVRDAQRRATQQAPLIQTIATVGASYYDGVHYTRPGNQQIATELFRQIARDFYGSTDTVQINSPNVRTARFNARRDTITLTFDESMRMVWPPDSTLTNAQGTQYTRRMVDFIYLDGQPGAVVSGVARRNQIILALRGPSTARTITYLPPYFSDANRAFYDGVHLKNERGLRAFSFDNFPLTTPDAPKLTQTIFLAAVTNIAFSAAPVTLRATASSELPVRFEVVSGPGTLINSHQLRLTGTGVITVKATQTGDDQYQSATEISHTLTVVKGSQQIGDVVRAVRTGQQTYNLLATASSGLPVAYSLSSGPASLTGNSLTISDLGQVALQLTQPGDDRYLPAPTISRTICLNPEKPTITTDPTSGLVLVSSSLFRNQWFLDGVRLPGETGQKLTVGQDGTYVVAVSNPVAACNATEQSAPRQFITLATAPAVDPLLRVYPNPATDQVRVRLNRVFSEAPVLQLMDGSGRLLYDKLPLRPGLDGYETTFSVGSLQRGFYTLRAVTKNGSFVSRLLIYR